MFIRLIESSLKFWIRSKCETISDLKFSINTTAESLLKGNINYLTLSAKRINFKELLLDSIKISAGNINLKLNYLPNKISFVKEFIINLKVITSGSSLEKTLLSPNWKWLGELISKELIEVDSLKSIEIQDNKLKITGFCKIRKIENTCYIILSSNDEKLVLTNSKNSKYLIIPMEDSICIKNAFLEEDSLNIIIEAKIKS